MSEAQLFSINYSCVHKTVGNSTIDNNVSKMTDIMLEPPDTSIKSMDDENGDAVTHCNEIMSLEQVGSVDGAVPEVAACEDKKTENTVQTING